LTPRCRTRPTSSASRRVFPTPCITGQQQDARPTLRCALNGGKESAELLGATLRALNP
jgi:hypothetical protein